MTYSWNLFLDDQWNDVTTTERIQMPDGWLPAATSSEAIHLVCSFGLPAKMMLDFDLGGEDRSLVFLKWLAHHYPNGPIPQWEIISKNVAGRLQLRSFLESWQRSLEL